MYAFDLDVPAAFGVVDPKEAFGDEYWTIREQLVGEKVASCYRAAMGER